MAKIQRVQTVVTKVMLELHPDEAEAIAAALRFVRGTAARAAGPIGQVKSRLSEGGFTGIGFAVTNQDGDTVVDIASYNS